MIQIEHRDGRGVVVLVNGASIPATAATVDEALEINEGVDEARKTRVGRSKYSVALQVELKKNIEVRRAVIGVKLRGNVRSAETSG